MDTLFANLSEGLAKAGMDRRGFLGKLAGAAGGAAVLISALATAARADSCGELTCRSCTIIPGGCPCRDTNLTFIWEVCYEIDCHTRERCGGEWRSIRGCGLPYCD